MENRLLDILKKYWGHQSFRPLQEDIIKSVLNQRDTIALLPTGGGKSICFQVPAMAMDGVCIVISPLIALMNDQVHNLRKKGIQAIAINSALTHREIDIALDNAVYGSTKFLYMSPERLQTDMVKARVQKMKVSLLAIDEAHCISEWGHDFRPAYRQIAEFRKLIPNTPVIALTATATKDVVEDIAQQLDLKTPQKFTMSFVRENVIYVVQKEPNKLSRMFNIINKIGGSGIVYVPTRRETLHTAKLLQGNGYTALPYHGGMDYKTRNQTQDLWIKNKVQIVVATNAFGMGIDKPDVRFVIHLHLPPTIEAYFQEAGRAGRDRKTAYAVCLTVPADVDYLRQRVNELIPEDKFIIQVYRALVNHLQLALGSSLIDPIPFDLNAFAKKYNLKATVVYNSLKLLEASGYLILSEAIHSPSRIQILIRGKELYNFEVKNPQFEKILQVILRSYEGVFDQPTRINENDIGIRTKLAAKKVRELLQRLNHLRVIDYQEQTDLPFISFPTQRLHTSSLVLNQEFIASRRKSHRQKMDKVIAYAESHFICRSIQLVSYFGDKLAKPCGKCDVCISYKKRTLSESAFTTIKEDIFNEISNVSMTIQKMDVFKKHKEKDVLEVLYWLLDNDKVTVNGANEISTIAKV